MFLYVVFIHHLYGVALQTSNTDGSRYLPVLTHNTPVPVRCQRTFTLTPEQTNFCLHLVQSSVAQPDPQSLAKVMSHFFHKHRFDVNCIVLDVRSRVDLDSQKRSE